MTERVRQLNEELANDPTPGLEDSRKRAIKFPENVVSQEIPPLDYTESEESDENQNKGEVFYIFLDIAYKKVHMLYVFLQLRKIGKPLFLNPY